MLETGTNVYTELGIYDQQTLNRFLEWNRQQYSSKLKQSDMKQQYKDLDETLERGGYIFILAIIALLSCIIATFLIWLEPMSPASSSSSSYYS